MKVNYTLLSDAKSGGSIVLYKIMNGLVERGHQVTVTLPGKPTGGIKWLSPKIELITPGDLRTRVNHLAIMGLHAVLKRVTKESLYTAIYRTSDELERAMPECDINVATYCLTAFPVFRSGKGIPFYHMQSYEPFFFSDPHVVKLAEESYYLPLNKIANSVWLRNQIKERFGEDIPIVNPGIDLSIFRRRRRQRRGLKKRVICYGSSSSMKAFPEAIEAMKIVFKERKDIEWVVFGLSPLKEHTNEAPYTFIQGIGHEELAELYSTADAVFCPSWYESFPLPPLEAMACGAPVVTTRYGTEDYCFHEENCLVVPPREPELMAEAILRLLEDRNLADKLSENGLKTAQGFTWDKTVDKIDALFRQKLYPVEKEKTR